MNDYDSTKIEKYKKKNLAFDNDDYLSEDSNWDQNEQIFADF